MPEHHPIRYKKWIGYYSAIRERLGADTTFMLDDAGPDLLTDPELADLISVTTELPERLSEKVNVLSFKEHLGRPDFFEYSGWWRSFTYSIEIARKYGFDKIVHIESDFYVLSDRLMAFIAGLASGWTSLYSHFQNFPETSIQVICKDRFPEFEMFHQAARSAGYRYKFKTIAENLLPFTYVAKGFNGDRFNWPLVQGWLSGDLAVDGLDYYGQLPMAFKPFSVPDLKRLLKDMRPRVDIRSPTASQDIQEVMLQVFHSNDMLYSIH